MYITLRFQLVLGDQRTPASYRLRMDRHVIFSPIDTVFSFRLGLFLGAGEIVAACSNSSYNHQTSVRNTKYRIYHCSSSEKVQNPCTAGLKSEVYISLISGLFKFHFLGANFDRRTSPELYNFTICLQTIDLIVYVTDLSNW